MPWSFSPVAGPSSTLLATVINLPHKTVHERPASSHTISCLCFLLQGFARHNHQCGRVLSILRGSLLVRCTFWRGRRHIKTFSDREGFGEHATQNTDDLPVLCRTVPGCEATTTSRHSLPCVGHTFPFLLPRVTILSKIGDSAFTVVILSLE